MSVQRGSQLCLSPQGRSQAFPAQVLASLGSASGVWDTRVRTAGRDPVVDKTMLLFVVFLRCLMILHGKYDKERNNDKEQL